MHPVARTSGKLFITIAGILFFGTATAQYLAVKKHGQTRQAFFPLAILHNQYRHNEDPIAPEPLAGSGMLMIGAGLVCFRLAVKRYRANEKTKFKIIY